MFVSLNDPVDVLTVFVEGRMEPLRFRWRGRVFRVKKITGRWNRREGKTVLSYFAIEGVGAETFELCYDPRGTRWILARAWTGTA
jgi:hypothetical protein